MASKQSNVDFVLEQMAEAGPVSARKMFGEYGIYCRDKIVALFCDDELFVKPTDEGRAFIEAVTEGAPYPGAKPWFLISGDRCEDGEWLSELVRITYVALPAAKPKPAKKQAKEARAAKPRTKPALSKSSGPSRGRGGTGAGTGAGTGTGAGVVPKNQAKPPVVAKKKPARGRG